MFSHPSPLFIGCATALVTPFLPDRSLDLPALETLILRQIEAGVDALVLLGTTGEPCTLTMQEREQVISAGIRCADGRIPIIIGTGSNDTRRAMEYARQAKVLGADGQLCVTPYYNKATQRGLLMHFGAILDCCDLPMILYHVPARTGMQLKADALTELSLHPGIAGIKDAGGDLSLTAGIIERTQGRLAVYSGNDDLILPMMSLGAAGAISVASNVVPDQVCRLTAACISSHFDEAKQIHQTLLPLMRVLFSQVNPIPAKAALSMMGFIHDELRLPLTPMDEPYRSRLKCILDDLQLIS